MSSICYCTKEVPTPLQFYVMMNPEEVLEQVATIICQAVDDSSASISRSTVASDFEGWDSLAHISIIVATEKHFKVSFTLSEIQSLENVGDFIDIIIGKI